MKVLITGANGFLGFYLCSELLSRGYTVIATGRGVSRLPYTARPGFSYISMDFTDPFAVHDVFERCKPDAVVHAGAMTRVDECEQKQWEAYVTNVEGTVTLLINAEEHKCFFLLVSTDFIFNGEKSLPGEVRGEGMYSEEDGPAPVNFYGKTKLEAEEAVKEYEFGWAIARTILVYGPPVPGGSNILTILKEKLEKGEEYKLVSDQLRTPTYVEDLAKGIASILDKKAKGVFHLSGPEVLSPYDMGMKLASYLELDPALILEVTADNFSQPAKRPPRTGFIINKARKILGFEPIGFEEGLKRTFKI